MTKVLRAMRQALPIIERNRGSVVFRMSDAWRSHWWRATMSRFRREEGQGLVEYGLILLFVALVVLIALTVFGQTVSGLYSQVVSSWP